MKISSHAYVRPSGLARMDMCDFWYNGNDRCAETPETHVGWEGDIGPPPPVEPPVRALTVREYINELNRLVILGEVADESLVVFNLTKTHYAYKPRVAPDGYLVIVG